MSSQENLSNLLSAVRTTRKLTLTEFAEELDISRTSLQTLLSGKCNPRLDTVERIANHLKIDPALLVSSSFSEEQWKVIFYLFNAIDAFSNLPDARKREASELIQGLINVFYKP